MQTETRMQTLRVGLSQEQFYPPTRRARAELVRLALGILMQAFRDVLSHHRSNRAWHKDALEWFFSEEERTGSLWWVCQILELEPEAIRNWLRMYFGSEPRRRRELAHSILSFRLPSESIPK